MRKQTGVSLSEVLISLFLSSLIVSLLMQFYLGSKRQYLEAEKRLNIYFEAQWVADLLSDSIRRAGFTPCLNLDHLILKDRREQSHAIQSLKIEYSPQQSIQVSRMNEQFSDVDEILNSTQIKVAQPTLFHAKRAVLIADCTHAEVQQISNQKGSLITLGKPLYFHYSSPVYLGEFLEEQWFMRKNPHNEPAFYYRSVQTEELSVLIHSFTVHTRNKEGKLFVEVVLDLIEGGSHKLLVAVRG